MLEQPERWDPDRRDEVYMELDHPADVFLEVWGKDLPALFENALFALYDQVAELEGFDTVRSETIEVAAPDAAGALRALLSEALYLFETGKFVASRGSVTVETQPPVVDEGVEIFPGQVRATARLNGETLDRHRHTLLSEVKAVTYHQLAVEEVPEGGWRATVLFDV